MYAANSRIVAAPTSRSGQFAIWAFALCDAQDGVLVLSGWVAVGLTGALLELGLLAILRERLAVPLPIATLVAAETLIIGKFLAADRLVFRHPWPSLERMLKYHGASAGALVVSWLVINGLAELAGVPYPAAFVVSTAAAFAWSLVTNFMWVWARRHS
jgi:dolichol-phosphate mannosyltransferase